MAPTWTISLLLSLITLVRGAPREFPPFRQELPDGVFFYDNGHVEGNLQLIYKFSDGNKVLIVYSCDRRPPQVVRIKNLIRTGANRFKVDFPPGAVKAWFEKIQKDCPRFNGSEPTGFDNITLDGSTNTIDIYFFNSKTTLKYYYQSLAPGNYYYHHRFLDLTVMVTENITDGSSSYFVEYTVMCPQDKFARAFGPFPAVQNGPGQAFVIRYSNSDDLRIYSILRRNCGSIGEQSGSDLRLLGNGEPQDQMLALELMERSSSADGT